ncbi:MAG: alpha-amylase family glycosyl hydrolase [Pseudomonadota bacterium]
MPRPPARRRPLPEPPWLLGLLLLGCAPERDCTSLLWWVGEAASVSVVGDWNGWEPEPLVYLEEEGAWRLQLSLPPGEYAYLFEVDGELVEDPFQPLLTWDPMAGEETSLLRVADCAEPALTLISAEATTAGDLQVDARYEAGAEGRLDPDTVAARLLDGTPLRGTSRPATGRITVKASGLAPGKHTVQVQAGGASLRVPLWVEERPWTWSDAVIYQVITDRFAGDDGPLPTLPPDGPGGRAGGTFAGLTAALESGYFADLRVNVLWLSPVYANPTGWWEGIDGHLYEAYHGYWPASASAVEPAMGGEEELRALITAAHARGVRVLFDVVPNHVHEEHPWYTEHAADWFHRDPDCVCGDYTCPWHSDIESCWFTPYLPDLALEEPTVRREVMASTAAWGARFDVDGFRVDAVPMMPRAAVRELIWQLSALEQGPSRFYTLGETYTGADTGAIRANLGPFGLDGQFEFPVLWALRDYLAWGAADAAALEATIARSEAAWAGSGSVMAPFVGNHDMPRFLSEAAGQDTSDPWGHPPALPLDHAPFARLVAAQALVLTLPGAPVIFYGDEVGQPGASDPDCRRTMPFDLTDEQAWTLARVQRLGQARACSLALRRGARVPILAEGPVYAHLRDAGDGAPALTVLNASTEARALTLTLPADLFLAHDRFVDVLEGGAVALGPGRTLALDLPPSRPSCCCPKAWTAEPPHDAAALRRPPRLPPPLRRRGLRLASRAPLGPGHRHGRPARLRLRRRR